MPNGPNVVEKPEFAEHAQKRMGKLLLDKMQQCKSKEFYRERSKYKSIGEIGKPHKEY